MKKLGSDIFDHKLQNTKPIKQKKDSPLLKSIFEWMQATAIAIVLVVIIMTFVFRVVDISGRSMMNTLLDGDKVLVYTLMYTPKNGDVVVISHAEHYDEPIVKRVIATAGQTVDVDFDEGKVYVDGNELYEPYLASKINGKRREDNMKFPVTVPENCVFVLGDNRAESLDSRSETIGFIYNYNVIGKALCVVTPFDRICIID